MNIRRRYRLIIAGVFSLWLGNALVGTAAQAQHPTDVQRELAAGEPMAALVTFDKMPKRKATTPSILAAAKSAWALSLPERAIAEFDRSLADDQMPELDRAKVYLARGIIEFQEMRYREALQYADKSLKLLADASPLRSKVWMLIAESQFQLASYAAANDKYEQALQEAPAEDQPDIHYSLGLCKLHLDKLDEAREQFEQVPLSHPRAGKAIRQLANIELTAGDVTHAAFWLARGQQDFPDEFLDSWVDYAQLTIAAGQNDVQRLREIRKAAEAKYPPADSWMTLLEAAAEEFEWRQRTGA